MRVVNMPNTRNSLNSGSIDYHPTGICPSTISCWARMMLDRPKALVVAGSVVTITTHG